MTSCLVFLTLGHTIPYENEEKCTWFHRHLHCRYTKREDHVIQCLAESLVSVLVTLLPKEIRSFENCKRGPNVLFYCTSFFYLLMNGRFQINYLNQNLHN